MNTKATLITIGDEILIGQIVDTNSAFIARELNKIGIEVNEILSVKDELNSIVESFERALSHSKIVIVTGGLGPTKDDKTKVALCQFLGCDLRKEPQIIENIQRLFTERGYKKELNNLNQDQALIPEKSTFIQNKLGTAPCLWTTIHDKIIINLPGVPFEMKALMADEVAPRLQNSFDSDAILHRDILLNGITESDLALLIEEWESALPSFIQLAYLPNRAFIDLRLTAKGKDKIRLNQLIENEIAQLKTLIQPYLVASNSSKIEQVLGDCLCQNNLTLSTAESCTSGTIASLITSISGSSAYFVGSVVAYSSKIKTTLLNVSPQLIEKHTVVSQEVAEAMAMGVREQLGTSIAISTTGVAGPNKGEDGKEVGTVWVSITNGTTTESKKYFYPYLDRQDFIQTITNNSLTHLVKFVQENYK